jgi:tetratricopeptide (TPR) repeat protein
MRVGKKLFSFFLLTLLNFLFGCALPPTKTKTSFITAKELEISKLVNKGISDFSRSRFIDAEESFLRALKFDPKNTALLHNLALSQFRNGEYRESQKNFLKLLDQEADSVNFHFEFANLLATIGDNERALSFLEVALSLREEEIKKDKLAAKGDVNSTEKTEIIEQQLNTVLDFKPMKQDLILKLPDIPLPVILAALAEISWRFGNYSNASCYAQRAYYEDRRIENLLLMLNIIIATDNLDFAANWIEEEIPDVVKERNSAVLLFLAKIALAKKNYPSFIKYAAESALAYDADTLVDEELNFLLQVLESLGSEQEIPEAITEAVGFWPINLKVILMSKTQNSKDFYELKLLPIQINERINKLRAEVD